MLVPAFPCLTRMVRDMAFPVTEIFPVTTKLNPRIFPSSGARRTNGRKKVASSRKNLRCAKSRIRLMRIWAHCVRINGSRA